MNDIISKIDDLPRQKVLDYARRFGEPHITLAMHAALPLGITPEIVHLIRINFVPDSPWISEADLLLSPLCQEVGGEFFEMDKEVREILLFGLKIDREFGPSRVKKIAEFLLAYVERKENPQNTRDMREFLRVHELVAQSYLNPRKAAEDIAEKLKTDFHQTNDQQKKLETIKIARLTQELTEPLYSEEKVLLYSAGIQETFAGNFEEARSLFEELDWKDNSIQIGDVKLERPELPTIPPVEPKVPESEETVEKGPSPISDDLDIDIFISYSFRDNESLIQGETGWVSKFHRALEVRLGQLMKDPKIWWDPKLKGNDEFSAKIISKLQKTKILVVIISPSYLKSEWCMKELSEFIKASESSGGIRVGNKPRIFLIRKTYVPHEEHPDEIRGLLGYDFFELDEKDHSQEFILDKSTPYYFEFHERLNDVAYDIADFIEEIDEKRDEPRVNPPEKTVYLAETTSDLNEERENIQRELKYQGYTILPDSHLPLLLKDGNFRDSVREFLKRCKLSIHLIGNRYGAVPEGEERSIIELQIELAAELCKNDQLKQLIWIPPGVQGQDDRQRKFLALIRKEVPLMGSTEILQQITLEAFKTIIKDTLKEILRLPKLIPASTGPPRIYLIYEEVDNKAIRPIDDCFFAEGFDVLRPLSKGSPKLTREIHKDHLALCDAAIIYYGNANEYWLRGVMTDLRKAPAYRRKGPLSAYVLLGPPKTKFKEEFRTHEASVFRFFSPPLCRDLRPIIDRLPKAEVKQTRSGASRPLNNPFPGLRPFQADESHLFFGREKQTYALIEKLDRSRFLTVIGPSGSGKSSLVHAGLLPLLHGGFIANAGHHWRVAFFRPGDNPIGNLAKALSQPLVLKNKSSLEEDYNISDQSVVIETVLRRGSLGLVEILQQSRLPKGENLMLVVDQFEELFRFKESDQKENAPDEAAAFVKLLLQAAQQKEFPVYVVLTLRSEFLGDLNVFRDLPEVVSESQFLMPRMNRDELKAAITGPIAVAGSEISPRLVSRLLNDIGDSPDHLATFQHAMMRTWDYWASSHKESEPLDVLHYEAIGTMERALSNHAEEAFSELKDRRRMVIAEKLFKAITEKTPDNRMTRRLAKLGEICAIADAEEKAVIDVINTFRQPGRGFLFPPGDVSLDSDTMIDISHESLIRNWSRLSRWVEEEAESAQLYMRLANAAELYEKKTGGLWRDPELMVALKWREEFKPNKAWAQRYHHAFEQAMAFLKESEVAAKSKKRSWFKKEGR